MTFIWQLKSSWYCVEILMILRGFLLKVHLCISYFFNVIYISIGVCVSSSVKHTEEFDYIRFNFSLSFLKKVDIVFLFIFYTLWCNFVITIFFSSVYPLAIDIRDGENYNSHYHLYDFLVFYLMYVCTCVRSCCWKYFSSFENCYKRRTAG